jgi:hypothetical protein
MSITTPLRPLRRFALPLLAAAIAFGIAACENPVQDDGDAHAVGVAVFSGSTRVAEYHEATRTASGEITVAKGETRTFRVRVVTASGGYRDIDGAEFSVRNPDFIVPNVANVELLGPDQLRITGQVVTPQQTTLILELQHGNHPEFTAELRARVAQ